MLLKFYLLFNCDNANCFVTGLTNGTPLRGIRRKAGINWCIPSTYFLEDTELRKQVNDEIRSRQVSSLFSYFKTKYSNF